MRRWVPPFSTSLLSGDWNGISQNFRDLAGDRCALAPFQSQLSIATLPEEKLGRTRENSARRAVPDRSQVRK